MMVVVIQSIWDTCEFKQLVNMPYFCHINTFIFHVFRKHLVKASDRIASRKWSVAVSVTNNSQAGKNADICTYPSNRFVFHWAVKRFNYGLLFKPNGVCDQIFIALSFTVVFVLEVKCVDVGQTAGFLNSPGVLRMNICDEPEKNTKIVFWTREVPEVKTQIV